MSSASAATARAALAAAPAEATPDRFRAAVMTWRGETRQYVRTPHEEVEYPGPAAGLQEVWIATRAALRAVLEEVTVADVAAGRLPPAVADLVAEPGACSRR